MKNSARNKINIIFSSFLVIGYIVCTYFFSTLSSSVAGVAGGLIQVCFLILFGLLLFYATRVGDGKQVRRFSLAVLLMVVLPCVYIIAASFVAFLPLHALLAAASVAAGQHIVVILASVALGYAIPYTFFSGYEMKTDDEAEAEKADAVVEGGLIEELKEAEDEAQAEAEAEEKAELEADAEREAEIEINIQETAE